MKYIMALDHEDGHTRYFGPVYDLQVSFQNADAHFGYEGSPYTISFLPLEEPVESRFLEFKRKDGET